MYLHIGSHTLIPKKDIIGIFDLDKTTISKRTRGFLTAKEKQQKMMICSDDLPQSFIVTKGKEEKVYLSQISSKTLYARSKHRISEE